MTNSQKLAKYLWEFRKYLPQYPWYYYAIGIFFTIIFILVIYNYLNKKFIEKNGYPILEPFTIALIAFNGCFLYGGEVWKEYIKENGGKQIYPNIIIGFALFCFSFFTLGLIVKYCKEKRKFGWLNIFISIIGFIALYIFTGVIIALIGIFIVVTIFGKPNNSRKRRNYYDEKENPFLVAQEQERIKRETPGPRF